MWSLFLICATVGLATAAPRQIGDDATCQDCVNAWGGVGKLLNDNITQTCTCGGANDDPTLLSSQIFFRHGHRAPRKTWPNDPYRSLFEGHLSELTTRGFYAAFNVGKRLRDWYASLLVHAAEDIHMRSTNSSRTIATAKSLLYGLLGATQPESAGNASLFQMESLISVLDARFGVLLPAINTVPLTEDQLLKRSAFCPRYTQLQKSISSELEAQFEARNRAVLQSIQSLMQSPNETSDATEMLSAGSLLRSAWRLYDSWYSWTMHELPIPPAFNHRLVQERLQVLAALKMRLFYVNSMLLHIRSHALRNQLLRNVALHADQSQSSQGKVKSQIETDHRKRKHSLSLYSTHDSTLTMLLCMLQLYSCKVSSRAFLEQHRSARIPPEFASVVMIDLYLERYSDSEDTVPLPSPNYTVGVWYYSPSFPNAERVRLKLPGCSERCPLGIFFDIVRSASEYSLADDDDVCEYEYEYGAPRTCHYLLIFVVFVFVILVCIRNLMK